MGDLIVEFYKQEGKFTGEDEEAVDWKYRLPNKFTNMEILSQVWWIKPFSYCFCRRSKCMKHHELYDKFYGVLQRDLDFITVFKRIHRIKSIVKNQEIMSTHIQ